MNEMKELDRTRYKRAYDVIRGFILGASTTDFSKNALIRELDELYEGIFRIQPSE